LGDSLNSNWNFGKADVVVADMPLAMSWRPSKDLEQDDRYKNYGKLPNKNEWPFILEGLDKLSDDGTMIALSAQGILFRAAKEYKVRRKLLDRKSTRLNSSHVSISYAVFCLKKKKIKSVNNVISL